MQPLGTTLETERGVPDEHAANWPPRPTAGSAMKFAYNTGDRPLLGYTIRRGVGIGGFGEVYFAVSDAGKEVALKCIQRNLDVELRGVTQCLNLKHPNLISLYDLKYDDAGQCWVVMEYVAGESLKAVLDRHPQGLPPDEVNRWFRGLAAGVGYLHEQGIVHRDLKPGNIFDDAGIVKIGDYGLSKFISASRISGQTEIVGTFQYMAPEVGKGRYGKEIDIYALGVILYQMLSGDVPFDGESSQEIIMKHLTDDPDWTRLPAPYQAVVQRALRKDPSKRFATARDVLAAWDAVPQVGVETGASRPTSRAGEILDADIVAPPWPAPEIVVAETVPPIRVSAPHRSVPPGASTPRGDRPRTATDANGSSQVLVVLAVILAVFWNPWLIPLAFLVGMVYAVYLGVREVVRAVVGKDATRSVAGPPVITRSMRKANRQQWLLAAGSQLRLKPPITRLTEWSGSLLLTAAICPTLSLLFLLLKGESLGMSTAAWSLFGWLTSCSLAGSWLLLTLAKFWEGQEVDGPLRRLVLLFGGLVLGLIAYAAGQWFLVDLPDLDRWTDHVISRGHWGRQQYAADGSPLLAAYVIFFGGLFVSLRWWRQVDPLRKHRFSPLSTTLCVLWAWAIHFLFRFPQPWGFALVATVSVAVQLAAPWVRPDHGGRRDATPA